MFKYTLPIFYTLYNYLFTKIKGPLIFVGLVFLCWLGGIEPVRSIQTVEWLIGCLVATILLVNWRIIAIFLFADEYETDDIWEDFVKHYKEQLTTKRNNND